jgi:hypothetical protein
VLLVASGGPFYTVCIFRETVQSPQLLFLATPNAYVRYSVGVVQQAATLPATEKGLEGSQARSQNEAGSLDIDLHPDAARILRNFIGGGRLATSVGISGGQDGFQDEQTTKDRRGPSSVVFLPNKCLARQAWPPAHKKSSRIDAPTQIPHTPYFRTLLPATFSVQ